MGGREVLELVDQQVAVGGLHPAPEGPVGEQRLDRRVDLLVEVDDALAPQLGPERPSNMSPKPGTSPRSSSTRSGSRRPSRVVVSASR